MEQRYKENIKMYKDDLWKQSEAFVKPPNNKNLEKLNRKGTFFDEDNEELEIQIDNNDYNKKNERSLIMTENDSEDEEKIAIIQAVSIPFAPRSSA